MMSSPGGLVLGIFFVLIFVGISCTVDGGQTSDTSSEVAWKRIAGVTIADDFPDYTSPDCLALCDSLRAAGATWVAVTPCGFLDSTQDVSVSWTRWSSRDYRTAIAKMRAKGLKVMLKPYLFAMDFWTKKQWTGDIRHNDSASRRAFFDSYQSFILDNARIAADAHVELFCIALELPHLSHFEAEWRSLIDTIRTVYRGPLTYAAHGLGESQAIRWWDAVDVIGVNLYPSLTDQTAPADSVVRAGWIPIKRQMERLSSMNGNKPIVLTEVGFRSVKKAMFSPWEWPEHGSRPIDHTEQAQAYRILADELYGEQWFGGVFWWKVFTDGAKPAENADGFTPQGKPAWKEMSDGFKAFRQ
ncbi:MAG: hypothetical protein MUC47_06350 [Candidatus Kapabacteria bacterium]|jgi:hypothetical protein|nr:hypothetical protein [Candidatus Kapabacteria bacterium]